MFNPFKKYFNYNEKEITRLTKQVSQINELEDKVRNLKDEDFPIKTNELKDQVQSGQKKLDDILLWSYALVREAARRTLNQRHFDVQLMAAIALHEGKVAEQKTGEGKTLSSTAPLYLNALTGKGVHLVTVNDYLARRDAGWMGKIFHFLGLSVSSMISEKSYLYDPSYHDDTATDWRMINLKPTSRKKAYEADITYGINSEYGFDYLRDNMIYDKSELRQRGFYYAIIDEVDSVLIDEARTPHIISAPYQEDVKKYYDYARLVDKLDSSTDYLIDEKLKSAHITEKGITKLESLLGVDNVYEKDFDTVFHVEAALKAKTLFKLDRDYIIKGNEIIIVDEFTGRLLQGRRFSEGIHQAIEAKENVVIKQESKTLATVSLQNYFRAYEKLAGMTGTAATESEEFHKIYKLNVIVLPTHREMVRKDRPDRIYKTIRGKNMALVEEIAAEYQKGRPVLVGTTSIDKNEELSKLLNKKGVPHQLLNAKNHEREAQIIADAGKKGSVTVATNMAGRGVDIILGGETPSKFKIQSAKFKIDEKKFQKEMTEWQKDHDEVVALGGLYVIGTERHESRRIDNQLRGRSGRQGDPGKTRFFVSLGDDMMRIFGGDQVSQVMTMFKFPEDTPIEHGMVSKALEQSQIKVEGFNFDIRKNLVEFDDVLNKQREIIYRDRRQVLFAGIDNQKTIKEILLALFDDQIDSILNTLYYLPEIADKKKLTEEITILINENHANVEKLVNEATKENIKEKIMDLVKKKFDNKETQTPKEIWHEVLKRIYLDIIDKYWTEHLTAIDDLRSGIDLRRHAQLDPLVEYKNEAFGMFERMLSSVSYDLLQRVFKIEITMADNQDVTLKKPEKEIEFKEASSVDPFSSAGQSQDNFIPEQQTVPGNVQSQNQDNIEQPQEIGGFKIRSPGTKIRKLGRNDPCWCGSGKKYKKCHYPN